MLHDANAARAQEKEKREAAETEASEAQQRLSAALVAIEESTAARIAATAEAERARDAETEATAALKRERNRSDALRDEREAALSEASIASEEAARAKVEAGKSLANYRERAQASLRAAVQEQVGCWCCFFLSPIGIRLTQSLSCEFHFVAHAARGTAYCGGTCQPCRSGARCRER